MKIVKYRETIDNWGRTETVTDLNQIAEVLRNPETWTDDYLFFDEENKVYFIDDLVGKEVELEGIETFKVEE
jgi:hypothetical protein